MAPLPLPAPSKEGQSRSQLAGREKADSYGRKEDIPVLLVGVELTLEREEGKVDLEEEEEAIFPTEERDEGEVSLGLARNMNLWASYSLLMSLQMLIGDESKSTRCERRSWKEK